MVRRQPTLIWTSSVVIAAAMLCTWLFISSGREVEFTVWSKEVACDPDGCKYLIFTSAGTFENLNSILDGKGNSAEVYKQLQHGQRYTAYVRGWRLVFFSAYPNIITLEIAQ